MYFVIRSVFGTQHISQQQSKVLCERLMPAGSDEEEEEEQEFDEDAENDSGRPNRRSVLTLSHSSTAKASDSHQSSQLCALNADLYIHA